MLLGFALRFAVRLALRFALRFALALTFALALALVLVAGSKPAQAATPPGRKAAAESLFQRGVELVVEGRYREACRKFEASQELDPALGTMLHLADCYEREGRTGSAWALFSEAKSLARENRHMVRHRIASERAAALEPRLVHLVIQAKASKGLVIELNGAAIPKASWGVPLPVDPGEQRILAKAPGRREWSTVARVPQGPGQVQVTVPELDPLPPRLGAGAGSVSAPVQRVAGYVTATVGALGLVSGAVLGLMAKERNDASREQCAPEDQTACTADGVRMRSDAQDLASAATATVLAGSLLTATGVFLVITTPEQDSSLPSALVGVRGQF